MDIAKLNRILRPLMLLIWIVAWIIHWLANDLFISLLMLGSALVISIFILALQNYLWKKYPYDILDVPS